MSELNKFNFVARVDLVNCLFIFFCCFLRGLIEKTRRWNWHFVASRLASLLASMESREFLCLRWDGEDWIYKWRGTGAVNSHPYWRPRILEEISGLFLFRYTPVSGDTIVDIGVENGDEIPLFCRLAGSSGRVIAIEADPACCRRLHKLKNLLELSNLEIFEMAVGSSAGQVKFSQDLGSLSNRIVKDCSEERKVVTVPMNTLQQILIDAKISKVNFLKVNIEGAEKEMLKGMPVDFPMENVCISCHDFIAPSLQTYTQVYSWLESNGYEVTRWEPEDHRRPWQNYYLYGEQQKQH